MPPLNFFQNCSHPLHKWLHLMNRIPNLCSLPYLLILSGGNMSTATIIDTYGQSYQLNPGVISIGPGKSNPIVLDNINGPDVVAELI